MNFEKMGNMVLSTERLSDIEEEAEPRGFTVNRTSPYQEVTR